MKGKLPKGYDSWLEVELHKSMQKCGLKPNPIEYRRVAVYNPDFCYKKGKYVTYIESKGYFRRSDEAKKYVDVRESLTKYEDLVFVFPTPHRPLPWSRKRKDGTRMTHAEWADKNGFKWYTPDTLPEAWQC